MKKPKLKFVIAGAVSVAAVATGTAMAATMLPAGSGSEQPATVQPKEDTPTADPIAVDGANVFPHSLDYDPESDTFYAGSLSQGKVFAFGPDGEVRTHIDDPLLVSAQAVQVDSERDRILVSNVDYGTSDRSDKDNPFGYAGVGSYDLETGEQDWCVDLRPLFEDGTKHLIADVTVAPDGTVYAVDQLTPTVFAVAPDGSAEIFLQSDLLKGTLDIPDFLDGVGMSTVDYVEGDQLIIGMGDGSLVRVPVDSPEEAQPVELSEPLTAPMAGVRVLEDGSLAAVSSGLLSGEPAQIQRVEPGDGWTEATVEATGTVEDPVTSDVTAGPDGDTYALSGGLADLLAGQPNDGFTLTPVATG
ncbi:hypothetical protein ACFOVU_14295 [Nocardiopsis sediminis]|uniref:SMP-30/Gluconolactonase/LRE-like region domain-containing protein n=1 Tax=Nocardiopsis sediminis TaxID=1778267 RepID=A0ABV8FNX1_9ACTN